MDFVTKVVISVGYDTFSIELAFNLLQRKVFAHSLLDLCILTPDVDNVRRKAECIGKNCFSNMNELVVTGDFHTAFQNADYLLLMSNENTQNSEVVEDFEKLTQVFKKAKSFDRWAKSNARVLVMGPQSNTWLHIFAEVAANLCKHNFTGLSRHYASKASMLIARKLDCEARELSNVYIWGKNCLDVIKAEIKTKSDSGNYAEGSSTRRVIELITTYWVDKFLMPQFQTMRITADRHCFLSAVCSHTIDWCRGTGDRRVCMATVVHRPGHVNDGIYSSYPVTIDRSGNITAVQDCEMAYSLFENMHRFYENLQKEKYLIRNYLKRDDDKSGGKRNDF